MGHGTRRVLVFDDDPEVGRLVAEILSSEGFEPLVAETHHTLDALLHERPHMVLVDYVLNGRFGEDFIARVRSGVFGHVPIVLCSAINDIEQRAHEIGAKAFVSKPFDIDTLVNTCREAVAA